ncbi:hypothetical protein, conserved [Eimeria maxima]|uniref:Btz domain-containing protein n=1 Tax=Eimeria maxima TaxID=5804 RepID=U6LZ09_EIMMA|nr:hypothetical protein, conserved [Eimeria maxima]CDJ56073.1 hypothetical protein, conserved [Eimeria maxima]
MGNPRNLRRASSQEEDEGDVFDEKSDVSSGSETEEEAPADAAPAGGSTETGAAVAGESSSAAAFAASSVKYNSHDPNQSPSEVAGDAHASSEQSCEAEGEAQRKTELANDADVRHRRSAAEGARQRPKSTWQLMQEDPSYVPRATRYFLHDDRRGSDSGESDESDEASSSQPDDSVPQSTQTRVGPSKKLWTPDENRGEWKHDMWELLQKEEAGERPPGSGWSRGRHPGEEVVVMPGCLEAQEEEGRGGWKPWRGRGRGQNWNRERGKQYVPKQTPKQTAEAA